METMERFFPRAVCICGLVALIAHGILAANTPATYSDLAKARDAQNLSALDAIIARNQQTAQTSGKPEAQYQLALANSYASEVALEMRDKRKSESYAEAGVEAARKAVAGSESDAEYHRLLGELCGQVIPANPLMGALKYGQCARDEINKSIQLNPNLPLAYVSRGVGNYYLPASMGGGTDLAMKDLDKAISLDGNLAEGYLWKGVILRKMNRIAESRQAFEKALQLNPNRIWAKQQLDKTPAH
jgi:tetratricopeptide (TPR) repeat protein